MLIRYRWILFQTKRSRIVDNTSAISLYWIRESYMNQKENKQLIAETANLESLINYQDDSIISRTLIDKKTGTVTLFAFDKNQGLSEHTAPYDAMVYMLDGEVEVTISGKSMRLKKGEMTIMPATHPHALTAKTKYKMLLIMIKS